MIIDRYIAAQIIRPLCLGAGLLVLVFTGYSAALQLNLAAAGRLDLASAFWLTGLSTFVTLEVLLPSALFFSVLAVLGRMYQDSEMNACYAAGISRGRMLVAVFKFALGVAVLTGFISIAGRPWAYRESYQLEAEAAARFDLKKMAANEPVPLQGSEFTFIADGLDLERGLHEGVFLQKKSADGSRTEIIVAKQASLPTLHPGEALTAEFTDGYSYQLDNQGNRDLITRYERMSIRLENQEVVERYRRKAVATGSLARSEDPKDIAEYQWRLSTPLATLLLALCAVPLARASPRQPRYLNFFAALALYIALLSAISILRTAIEQGRLAAFPGLWMAYAIPAAALALLLRPPRRRRRR